MHFCVFVSIYPSFVMQYFAKERNELRRLSASPGEVEDSLEYLSGGFIADSEDLHSVP